jgi:hypothetical protein
VKRYPVEIRIGGIDAAARNGFKGLGRLKKGHVHSGLTSSRLYSSGRKDFKVWINGRESERQLVHTFFHEMTHVLCKILGLKSKNEEALCEWVGYLAKTQFADLKPKRFGRREERKK